MSVRALQYSFNVCYQLPKQKKKERQETYPAHLMAEAHIGQLSALVYRDKSAKDSSASDAVKLYGPLGSVRMSLQLAMAAISPVKTKR